MFRKCGTLVLFSVSLLFAASFPALAQNTGKLSGVVRDASTGESLPGANVIIQGTQLGTASDVDGTYFVIGVPVGTYDITASYVGYQPQTFQEVEINAGYTRQLDFELMPGAELEEILVQYERPILQQDAIGVPRVVTAEQLTNLPIRGLGNVASLQSGVVTSEGTGLHVRGGREQELVYYLDGVRLSGQSALHQQAIAEQEMLIGTIPAKYGDVQGGVVSVTTKSGADRFFGTFEGYTSQGLDSYGHNLANLSLGGPIVPGRISFFASGQYLRQADSGPYGAPTYQLTDDQLASLHANPQLLRFTNEAGDSLYLPFPWQAARGALQEQADGTPGQPLSADSVVALLNAPEGYVLASAGLINAPDTYREEDFTLQAAKDRPFEEMLFNGNVTVEPTQTITLRMGGGYETQRSEGPGFGGHVFNPDFYSISEEDTWRAYGSFRQRFARNFFYQIDAAYQDYSYVSRPNGFSTNVEDALHYGDLSGDYLELARRYFTTRVGTDDDGSLTTLYQPLYTADGTSGVGRVLGLTFSLPGAPSGTYRKQSFQRFQLSGNATAQIGLHQIEFGGEYRKDTNRWYGLDGFGLSRYFDDGEADDGATPGAGCEQAQCYSSYDQLPFDAFRERAYYYGYDFRGLNEVDSEDVHGYFTRTKGSDGYFDPGALNVSPHEPIYYGGYVQDKIEYRDLVLNLGVRVDVYDNNTTVLKDIYAPRPIVRAGSLGSRPGGIGSDYAVYYNDEDQIVGYRDLDGNFFDAEGSRVDALRIVNDLSGQARPTDAPLVEAFEDYEPQVTIMPRIGVSFPVTDQAVFFASYNVTSQRATERAYAPFRVYEEITTQNSRTSNPKLNPERTTQYELGFRQRLGSNTALTISGFYRTQQNKISNRRLIGGLPSYGTYLNADFTTTKGVEFGFDLRRVRHLSVNANYTLAYAQGTGSDAGATSVVVWRGSVFPNTIAPADFDQRHTVNASVDYRLGEGEGPMIGGAPLLENLGINVLARYGSGMAYTAIAGSQYNVGDSFTEDAIGSINSARLPSTTRIDVRVDRRFNLGSYSLTAYVNVLNLLDAQNILAVYRATGLPDNDGYLATAGGQSFLNTRPDPTAAAFLYGAYTGGPVNVGSRHSSASSLMYSRPRRVRVGILLNF